MKRVISLLLIFIMVLSAIPHTFADELSQGSFYVSGNLNSGKGTISVKLSPPVESITVSAVEMEVVLPEGFSFGGRSSVPLKGWETVPEKDYELSNKRKARKIALYTTGNAIKTEKNASFTIVDIPVNFPSRLKPGDQTVDINVTDIAVDVVVGDKTTTVSGLDYFEATSEDANGNRVYEYVKTFKYEKNISAAQITNIVTKTYTGGKIKQNPTIVVDGNKLIENTDYALQYSNNTNCGIATVTILGRGGYKGQVKRTFNIIPAAVYEITCSNPTANSVKITWETSKNVDGYYILRSTTKTTEDFSIIKTVTGAATSTYIDNTVLSGRKYYYKVQAYKNIGGKNLAGGLTSATPSSTTSGYTVDQPTGLKVSATTASTVSLKWSKTKYTYKDPQTQKLVTKYGTEYYIYRSTSKSSGYKLIATIKGTDSLAYKDSKLSANTTYYYRVEPYKLYKGIAGKGPFASVTAKTDVKVSAPKSFKTSSNTTSSIKLSWKKVSKANGYYIYRSTKKTSGFKKIKTITKGSTVSFTNQKLSAGKTYYYRVIAYQNYNGKKCESSYSQITACTKPKAPKKITLKKDSETSLKITVSKASGAKGYQILYSTKKSSGFKKAYSGSKLTYTKKSLKKGKTYFVKVRAYKSVGSKKYYGAYSSVKSIKF